MQKRYLIIVLSGLAIIIAGIFAGYSAWNAANPERTCASCHEINPSHDTWLTSSHREIECFACHGTALSNGFHSLKEKTGMVFSHLKKEQSNININLSEEQLLMTMERCAACHQEEYKKWASGGHAANYADIFLNEAHNQMEQPYWDCFRCHGMFYEGNIHDLISPVSNQGPWSIIDEGKHQDHVILCLTCHEIHTENDPRMLRTSLDDPKEIFYERKERNAGKNPKAGLFIRADQIFLRADQLPKPDIYEGNRMVRVSENPLQRICTQCHAPDWEHIAGTEDDRTPSGVHEGLACMACHETHSNDASNACSKCHPTISNCGLDHKTMNTSYNDSESPNNIHHVKCADCHDKPMR